MNKYNNHIILLIIVLILFLMCSSVTKTEKELFSNNLIDQKQTKQINELKKLNL